MQGPPDGITSLEAAGSPLSGAIDTHQRSVTSPLGDPFNVSANI